MGRPCAALPLPGVGNVRPTSPTTILHSGLSPLSTGLHQHTILNLLSEVHLENIDAYLDAARTRAGIASDRALSVRLGYKEQAVNAWRLKRAWPSDESMIALASLAGIEPSIALIDLNYWRAKTSAARKQYSEIRRQLARAVMAAVLIVGILAGRPPASGGTNHERVSRRGVDNIHYARIWGLFIKLSHRAANALKSNANLSGNGSRISFTRSMTSKIAR
jgi:hypothetical protein